MISELKRLIEKTESTHFSKDNSGADASRLIFNLPDTQRENLSKFEEELLSTFSVPSALIFEQVKDNIYNCEFAAEDDTCTIGQFKVDPYTLTELKTLTLPVRISFRVPEIVNSTIEDLTDEKPKVAKVNIPELIVDTEGESTVSFI